jgi:hypothetical protein
MKKIIWKRINMDVIIVMVKPIMTNNSKWKIVMCNE